VISKKGETTMKQTPNELHNELMDKLKEFTEEVGYVNRQQNLD